MSNIGSRQSDVSFSPSVYQGFQTTRSFQEPTPKHKARRADPLDFSTPPSAQPQRNTADGSTSSSGESEESDGSDSDSESESEGSSGEAATHGSGKSITNLIKRFGDDLENVAKAEVELWERSTPQYQKLANNMVTPQKLKAKYQAIHRARGKLDDFRGYPPTPGTAKKHSMPGAHGTKTVTTDNYDGYESNIGYRLAIGASNFEQIRQFVTRHPFTVSCVLQESYAVGSRRSFFHELYNYARGLGCSSRQAKQAIIYARYKCGEERYDSDNTTLGGHASDSSKSARAKRKTSKHAAKIVTSDSDSDDSSSSDSSVPSLSSIKTPTKAKRSQRIDYESVPPPAPQPAPKRAEKSASVGNKPGPAAANRQPSQNEPVTKRKRVRSKRPKRPDQPPPPNTAPAAHNLEDVFSVSYGRPGTTFPDRPDPVSESATAALNVAKANKRKFGALEPKPPIYAEPSKKKSKRRKVHKDAVEEMVENGIPPATALTAALPSTRELTGKGDEIMEAPEEDKEDLKRNYGDLMNTTGGRAIAVKKRNEKRKADGYSPPEVLKHSPSPIPIYVNEREKQNALRRSGERARKADKRLEQTSKRQDQLDRVERERKLDALSRKEKIRAHGKASTHIKADATVSKPSPPAMEMECREHDSDRMKRDRLDDWRMEVNEGPFLSSSPADGRVVEDVGENKITIKQEFDFSQFPSDGIAILIPPSPDSKFKRHTTDPSPIKKDKPVMACPTSDLSSAFSWPRTPSPLPVPSCSESDYEQTQHLSRRRTISQTKNLIPSITRAKSMDILCSPIPLRHKGMTVVSSKVTPLTQPSKPLKSCLKRSPYFPKSQTESATPRQKVSAVPFPSTDSVSFGLVQEKLCRDPFRLLIAVIFLNKTKGAVAMPVFYQLMDEYPTPADLAAARHQDVVDIIQHLGLQNQRAKKCIALATAWLKNPPVKGKRYRRLHYPNKNDGKNISVREGPTDDDDERVAYEVSHLPGIGDYAIDSWRIFCRDELRGLPTGLPRVINAETKREELRKEWAKVIPKDKELRAYLRWRWLRLGYEWDPLTGKKKKAEQGLRDKVKSGGIIHEHDGGGMVEPETEVEERLRKKAHKTRSMKQAKKAPKKPKKGEEKASCSDSASCSEELSDTDVEKRNPIFIPKEPSPISSGHYPSDFDYPEQEDSTTPERDPSTTLSDLSSRPDLQSVARIGSESRYYTPPTGMSRTEVLSRGWKVKRENKGRFQRRDRVVSVS